MFKIVWVVAIDYHKQHPDLISDHLFGEFNNKAEAEAWVNEVLIDEDVSFETLPLMVVAKADPGIDGMVVDEKGNIALTEEKVELLYELTKKLRKQAKKAAKKQNGEEENPGYDTDEDDDFGVVTGAPVDIIADSAAEEFIRGFRKSEWVHSYKACDLGKLCNPKDHPGHYRLLYEKQVDEVAKQDITTPQHTVMMNTIGRAAGLLEEDEAREMHAAVSVMQGSTIWDKDVFLAPWIKELYVQALIVVEGLHAEEMEEKEDGALTPVGGNKFGSIEQALDLIDVQERWPTGASVGEKVAKGRRLKS